MADTEPPQTAPNSEDDNAANSGEPGLASAPPSEGCVTPPTPVPTPPSRYVWVLVGLLAISLVIHAINAFFEFNNTLPLFIVALIVVSTVALFFLRQDLFMQWVPALSKSLERWSVLVLVWYPLWYFQARLADWQLFLLLLVLPIISLVFFYKHSPPSANRRNYG